MTSNRKRVLLFVIKFIFLIFRADDFTKSFLANLPFCRQSLLFSLYPFGFQCFVVLLSFADQSPFGTAATAYPSPIHRLGINCLTAPFTYSTPPQKPIIPCPFAPFYSSLRSFLPCHYSLFRRQYEPLYVIVREVLLTFALIQPTLDRFPHFVSYPPTLFFFSSCTIWLIKVIPTSSFPTTFTPPIASHYQPIRNFLTF